MSAHDLIRVRFFHPGAQTPFASTLTPRKLIVKTGTGCIRRRCWLELYHEDSRIPLALGSRLEVNIRNTLCFQGRITERRLDSVDDPLTLFAEWDPVREYDRTVSGAFAHQSATGILDQILPETGLVRSGAGAHAWRFQRLVFAQYPLFSAIDLLAKLAGNWFWDVQENGRLRFRPPAPDPDHRIEVDNDRVVLHLWETVRDQPAAVELLAGLEGGAPLGRVILLPPRAEPFDDVITRVYARPIASSDGIAALRQAILQQMSHPRYSRYIDLEERGETILPGDTLCLWGVSLPGLPPAPIFRVKGKETVYAHETYTVRLHLTSGYESSPTYFYHLRRDAPAHTSYLRGRAGVFQLDLSGLDSLAPLDGF